jgi:uncharacterized protein (TIGR03435 family)
MPHDPSKPFEGWQWGADHRFRGTIAVDTLIDEVFGVQDQQVHGAPEWVFRDVYDMQGVPEIAAGPTLQERRRILYNLLQDRFALRTHTTQEVMPVLVLKVHNPSRNLKVNNSGEANPTINMRAGERGGLWIVVRNASLDEFARWAQQAVSIPILNETHLAGKFDFDLRFSPDNSMFGGTVHLPESSDPPPSLYSALREKVGLSLTRRKAPATVVNVDNISRPSPN